MSTKLESQFEGLSTKEGFNTSLRHFNLVMEVIDELESTVNLADVVNNYITEKRVDNVQIKPIVNALLVDRYGYQFSSYNLKENVEDFKPILDEAKNWTSLDMVLCYYSPELGLTLVNPKNSDHWDNVRILKKNEFVTLYCGAFNQDSTKPFFSQAVDKMVDMLEGKSFKTPAIFTGGKFKPPVKRIPKPVKAPKKSVRKRKASPAGKAQAKAAPEVTAPQSAPAPVAKSRMTPLYGITVTNELFHNGNVEAWKKIIESYETYNKGLKVFVFYEGERIQDINTLFKWGKVKRGTAIMIAVAGELIKDVAKLQKYLRQGASHMFEAFLKGHPHKVLELF
jgi:hypothetical protein